MQWLIDFYASLEPQTRLLSVLGFVMGIGLLLTIIFSVGDPDLYETPTAYHPLGYRRSMMLREFFEWF